MGLAGVTDLRNQVYAKVVQQPIGFFQHNPVGRVMSAVISDIEQMRSAFSDWLADFFRQIFTLVAFVCVLLVIDWSMALGSVVLIPLVVSREQPRQAHPPLLGKEPLAPRGPEPDPAGNVSGNRVVKAFGMEGFEIGKFREAASRNLLARKHALDQRLRRHVAADGSARRGRDLARAALLRAAKSKCGRMTIGSFGAFTFAFSRPTSPSSASALSISSSCRPLGASAQVFAFLDLPEEEMEAPGAKVLPRLSTVRRIRSTRVSPTTDGPLILQAIST